MALPIDKLDKTDPTDVPTAVGNAGVFIKPDGSVRMFQAFEAETEDDFTTEQIETGKKLVALTVALRVPQIMDILLQMANDPDIVEPMHS